jgi:hypothetical protein
MCFSWSARSELAPVLGEIHELLQGFEDRRLQKKDQAVAFSTCPIAVVHAAGRFWDLLSEPANYAQWWEAQTRAVRLRVPHSRDSVLVQSHHLCSARRDHLPRKLRVRVFLLAWMVGLDTGALGSESITRRGCRSAGATPTHWGTMWLVRPVMRPKANPDGCWP